MNIHQASNNVIDNIMGATFLPVDDAVFQRSVDIPPL